MRYFNFFLLVACLLILQACSSLQTGESAQQQPVAEADATTKQAAAGQAAEAEPDPVPAVVKATFAEAVKARQAGDAATARQLFERLVRDYPDFAGPHINLGLIALENGEPEAAEAYFRQALTINPDRADAYVGLGLLARQDGRFSDAESHYLKALEKNPDNAEAHLNLGVLYDLYMGRLEDALRHYKAFQNLQSEPVEQVKFWIVDIEARL